MIYIQLHTEHFNITRGYLQNCHKLKCVQTGFCDCYKNKCNFFISIFISMLFVSFDTKLHSLISTQDMLQEFQHDFSEILTFLVPTNFHLLGFG